MMRRIIFMAFLLSLCGGTVYAADSARCTELGANCICNVTMDTTSISSNGADTQHFKLNDGVTKICSSEVSGYSIDSGSGQVFTGVTSGEDITALPSGHTVTAVLRSDTTSGAFLGVSGVNIPASVPTARRAIRFYKYYSSAYNVQSTTSSSCNANKLAQFGTTTFGGPLFNFESGTWTLQDINTAFGWNVSIDCCNGPGPGNTSTGPTISGMVGKWWRIEIITRNAATTGTGSTWQLYLKNVTDNGSEMLLLDTSVEDVAQGWTSPTYTAGLHPTSTLDTMLINFFRSTNGATPCAGFASYSHYLYAAWSTDAAQRIGAATEVEGSGGSTYSSGLSGVFRMQGVGMLR